MVDECVDGMCDVSILKRDICIDCCWILPFPKSVDRCFHFVLVVVVVVVCSFSYYYRAGVADLHCFHVHHCDTIHFRPIASCCQL